MQKLLIANWKSHKTMVEAQQWVDEFVRTTVPTDILVAIAPPFPFLPVLQYRLTGTTNVTLAAQTLSSFPAGSYTGAVSGLNVKNLGVTHAIVGHSERRRYFHETNQDIAKQVEQSLANGITPVVCIDIDYLAEQASAIESDQLKKCVVAYEPVEAIGSGNNAAVAEVTDAAQRIRTVFGDVPVLYGGSVDSANVREYTSVVDGFIVGTASLNVDDFSAVVRKASEQK